MSLSHKMIFALSITAIVLSLTVESEAGWRRRARRQCCPCAVVVSAHIASPATAPAADHQIDIVDTAVHAGLFKTLAAALKAAGLIDTLKSKGPFTVFAPTDAAFAKLPAGTVESLLKPENKDKLTAILTYHVVAGNVKAADVVKLNSAKTVQGQEVTINATNGVKINDSKGVTADIECSNGVIHVIDTVLLPK